MEELKQFILSTFNIAVDIDATQFRTNLYLQKLNKSLYKVYITPIKIPALRQFQARYEMLVKKALDKWTQVLFETDIQFQIINTPYMADIKVYWGKGSQICTGKQFFEEYANLKIPCVSIGLVFPNGEVLPEEKVYHLLLHEFGHILGLGHSPDERDVMCGCGRWATEFTQNDILVLNLIYAIKEQKNYNECESFINKYIDSFGKQHQKNIPQNQDLLDVISNIGMAKILSLSQHSIQVNIKPNAK